jgi:hypothetical protein
MEVVVKFVPSAFKHSITEANIRHAILNWRYDDMVENDPGKHLLIVFEGYILTKYVGMYPEKNTLPKQPYPVACGGVG